MTISSVPVQAAGLDAAVSLFRGLADPSRLAIVRRLADGEARVVDLTRQLDLAQSTVSGHLACLRDCGLVTARPEGRQMFYSLARPELAGRCRLPSGCWKPLAGRSPCAPPTGPERWGVPGDHPGRDRGPGARHPGLAPRGVPGQVARTIRPACRDTATAPAVQAVPADAESAARVALAASIAAGNPISQPQLMARFGLTRTPERKVHQLVLAASNGHGGHLAGRPGP